MGIEDKKVIAQGMAALCVMDAWNKDICDPFSKHEEVRAFMQNVVSRLYSVLLHTDDPGFMKKLTLYGSLTKNVWGEPQEVKGLLEGGLVDRVSRMTVEGDDT